MPHDLGERCTSAPHAQHEGARLEHAPHGHGHAQQAWAQACTCQRQTAQVHRAYSTGTQPCAARAHKAKTRKPPHSEGTHGAHRGRMHAQGACLPCRVQPVRTLGAAAMPPPTGSARRCAGETDATSRHASATRRKRGALPAAAKRASPGPPHRTPHDGCARDATAAPLRRQTRTQRTTKRATTEPAASHARARPRPPPPPPTHRAPMCPIFLLSV